MALPSLLGRDSGRARTSDWQSEKKDAESAEKDARKKEENWKDLATQFQKLKG